MPEKTTEPGRKPAKKPKPEVVEQIPLSELHPFPDHPFQVRDDDAMKELLTAKAILTVFWSWTRSRKKRMNDLKKRGSSVELPALFSSLFCRI